MIEFSSVILAGGASRRMGRDKGLLPFHGLPMVGYILRQLEKLGAETLIVTNHPDGYEQFKARLVPDEILGLGALGGIYSALKHARCDRVLILACDMPFIKIPLINWMLELAPGFDAVVPRLGLGLFEPFRSVYAKACLPAVKKAIDAGERRATSFLADVNVRYVEREEIQRFDPSLASFMNINSREDLARAESLAEEPETAL
ncbi:MAG: molybdenum cofactor guanylyltransferase [Anaerolineales bacterium]